MVPAMAKPKKTNRPRLDADGFPITAPLEQSKEAPGKSDNTADTKPRKLDGTRLG